VGHGAGWSMVRCQLSIDDRDGAIGDILRDRVG
jgi:hypothetical protein